MQDPTTSGNSVASTPDNLTAQDNSSDSEISQDSGIPPQDTCIPMEPHLRTAELNESDRAEVAAFRENLLDEDLENDVWLPDDTPDQSTSTATDLSAAEVRASSGKRRRRIPGPGIPEAIVWMLVVLGIHVVGMIIALTAVMTLQLVRMSSDGTPPTPAALETMLRTLPETYGLELITVEMLVFLVGAVLATRLRMGAGTSHLLGIRSLTMHHFFLILAVSIPIALMCGGLHQMATAAWDQWFADLPGMNVFNEMNINETIKPLGDSAPLSLLFLVIAVAPAIGEEVIFRGIIGRGLVARHGIVAGVIMTSLMFAAVHIHPAHVVSLLPLAFFIHLVYLTTRSILAPMLLHLLNNSLAVILLKISAAAPEMEGVSDPEMPAHVMLISAAIVIGVGWTLWRSRVQYRNSDGSLWDPGYPTVEIPPESADTTLTVAQCPAGLYRGAIGLAGAFSLMFILSLILMLTGHIAA